MLYLGCINQYHASRRSRNSHKIWTPSSRRVNRGPVFPAMKLVSGVGAIVDRAKPLLPCFEMVREPIPAARDFVFRYIKTVPMFAPQPCVKCRKLQDSEMDDCRRSIASVGCVDHREAGSFRSVSVEQRHFWHYSDTYFWSTLDPSPDFQCQGAGCNDSSVRCHPSFRSNCHISRLRLTTHKLKLCPVGRAFNRAWDLLQNPAPQPRVSPCHSFPPTSS
jgi:hypothetical protein